ncbi:hypothetical protein MKW98_023943 [Papaver atlanticum]|uniref:Uncharacterized protein n=1 Tax=Papaver atlanticum TaxID=357466 RepID=A0AAD4XP71_9MAGN|nr:hypothetical protein MKW98_023943 [Papaver atlanticum]
MMMMKNTSGSFGYAQMEKEDPEDMKHRKAQFMIYKTMQKADVAVSSSSPSSSNPIRIRICRLKIKFGNKLKRLRKSLLYSISSTVNTRVCAYKQFINQLKNLKRLVRTKQNRPTTTKTSQQPIFLSSSLI